MLLYSSNKERIILLSLHEKIIKAVVECTGDRLDFERISSVSGGSINQCYKACGAKRNWLVKVNDQSRFPHMFSVEEKGLGLLRASGSFAVPQCAGVYHDGAHTFLIMEWVEAVSPSPGFDQRFAEALFKLHATKSDAFGLDHDNYIGSLPQSNKPHTRWHDFFVNERVWPMAEKARMQHHLQTDDMLLIQKLLQKVENFFPVEEPSLLHGDLWCGNFLCDPEGRPVLIDPAVYFGHRYMDLGMMQLFGGFSTHIFNLYVELAQLNNQWREGVEVAKIYPLLVHVLLFGTSYVTQLQSIVRRFA